MNDLCRQFGYKYWISTYNRKLDGVWIEIGVDHPALWFFAFQEYYAENYN
jgi:hypothetical protein